MFLSGIAGPSPHIAAAVAQLLFSLVNQLMRYCTKCTVLVYCRLQMMEHLPSHKMPEQIIDFEYIFKVQVLVLLVVLLPLEYTVNIFN